MMAATPGGALLVLAVLLPVAGILVSFALGGRVAEKVTLALAPLGFALAWLIAMQVAATGAPIVYTIAGLPPPLGIALRADGVSAVMLLVAAVIVAAAAFYARAKFATPEGQGESRGALTFWLMLQAIWAALILIFLGGDLFNLYVALELLTFAAVPLVCIDGRPETLAAALRYLLFALFGSIIYLLGVALLYGAYGTLDIVLLAQRVAPTPVVWTAAALMTAGLIAKTALFPLHIWLPPAHANAPAAASAVLSGLVVKGSFFLALRLWFYVLPALPTAAPSAVLGTLGAFAAIVGSVLALRQARLKLLVAYSTVAQIGYLFLVFPLAAGGHAWSATGWSGGMMQVLAHAFAKAAMFLSAGLLAEALGHDQIAKFKGAARALPLTFLTLGLGGLSLTGLPPSGGFEAKWLMLRASIASGQWIWSLPILAGGLLAAGYVYRILAPALADGAVEIKAPPQRSREAIALGLAVIALALAFAPQSFFHFLEIGRPLAAGGAP
ncbi:NADH-quinone oxidoreductase subunit J [Rhodoblastus acidophilus]|uniref:NADH-quinone oxidoreductase subunit J n=1 Tax=Candidatus Rhodoblastus alkanivorans TaxID=2954117 RepID=A0ABS9Z6Z2_9HYPH|nr:proton-conducting transporter membrane subunit [Candidatus Rhodoblastus alkanivorans]MCI4680127.1 NADH-quinone oxidoreductase subunit J [Candidatus Rhodoblastus alkanivorans]MCI4683381.1 NADH-quinone oxidoreductase subunit J [Candidatus Rhodoblastus alkanivorans]MDI4640691.1 NADH-quinone oxidoreductase subunit J [Rhodoblastus acidophilus]